METMNTYERFKEIMLSKEYNSVQKGEEILATPLQTLKLIDEQAEELNKIKNQPRIISKSQLTPEEIKKYQNDFKLPTEIIPLETEREKRYREALEFYANENSYVEYVALQEIVPTVMIDKGKMAKQALKEDD